MKVAILLMVHKNLNQINRLLDRLEHPACDIFVHIDKKSDISEMDFRRMESNIHVLEERFDVVLFSFQMIKATLALIDFAKDTDDYDYFMLMSGQDYLLKPIDEIVEELNENYPKSYIDITPWHKRNWVYNTFARANCFKIIRGKNNIKASHISNRVVRFIYKCIFVLPFKLISYFKISPYKILQKHSVAMYGGAQWWILSKINIDDILEYYKSMNKKAAKALEHVGSPDETFFQTCLMNTAHTEFVTLNQWDETKQNCMTFTIFTQQGHPIILKSEKFKLLEESDKWIARKFDINIDQVILDRIDSKLLHVK